VKINVKGGILSIGTLHQLVGIAKEFYVSNLHIGERQDVYFGFDPVYQDRVIDRFATSGLVYEIGQDTFPNIVSSYASQGIFTNHPWMGEGLFQDILDSFDYNPTLRINIVDPFQSLVPLFTGDINFLPSSKANYFHIYFRNPSVKTVFSPDCLVYVSDLSNICRIIAQTGMTVFASNPSEYLKVWESELKLNLLPHDQGLKIPRHRFHYYVGMNKGEVDNWLGIFRRNNDFPIDFLASLYEVASASGIGQINLTTWRSILIKGIKENDRILWETILSRHGINTRYSSNELNWQLPNRDKEALRIKNDLIRDFTEQDIRTFGLTFAIVTDKTPEINSSVVIQKKGAFPFLGIFKALSSYDISITENFEPNGLTYKLYEQNVSWSGLAIRLRNLSRRYFDKVGEISVAIEKPIIKEAKKKIGIQYQCTLCFTIYDEQTGDPILGIAPNTKFQDLPEDYCCQLCGEGMEKFEKVVELMT
jgi:rubredoxin